MKKVFLFLFALLLFGGLIYVSSMHIQNHVKENPSYLLTSPFQLNILSISFSTPEKIFYLSKKSHKDPKKKDMPPYEWLFAFSPIIAAIVALGTISIFFLFRVELNAREISFLILNISFLVYFFSFTDYLTENQFHGLFYLIGFLINIPFIYFFRNLMELKTSGIFFVISFLLSIIFFVLFYPLNFTEEILILRHIGLFQFLILTYCVSLLVLYIKRIIRTHKNMEDQPQTFRQDILKVIFALIFAFGFSTSSILFSSLTFLKLEVDIHYNAFFFLPAFSVGMYAILGPRFGLVSLKVVIHEFLLRGFFLIFFTLLYLFFIGFNLLFIFDEERSLFFHLIIVVLFLLLLDPLRTIIVFFLDNSALRRNTILREYLSQISYYFNDPGNLITFFNKISKAIEEGLETANTKLYFGGDIFNGINLQTDIIRYNNSIWSQINKKKRFFRYPTFTKSSAGEVGKLLEREKAFILISFQKFHAAIVVSEKKNQKAFLSSDIKFLRSLLKYGESLLQNYQSLLETTKIRRHQSELSIAANIQKKILPSEYADKHIKLCLIIRPFQKVTGDYIDFFQKSRNDYMLFLGDVSGHGLGSAYLMTMIHSMIRGSVQILGESLDKTFNKISRYLVNEYRGDDFITLMGIRVQIHKEKKSKKEYASLEFVNAGQHPALIYLQESDRFDRLESHQRVMGVIDTEYTIYKYSISETFRIFMYSDGVFEIFNKEGKIIGEKEVQTWITQSNKMGINEQKQYILEKIRENATGLHIMDDISLMIAEIKL